jgi:hypothetical protein
VLNREATNTNVIVFGVTRLGLEPTIYHTRTHDLPHSNPRSTTLEPTIYHTRTHDLPHSNPRSTTLEPTIYHTRTITPPMQLITFFKWHLIHIQHIKAGVLIIKQYFYGQSCMIKTNHFTLWSKVKITGTSFLYSILRHFWMYITWCLN